MSGIVGIYRLDGTAVAEADLDRMLQKLKHRGPDGLHSWQSGPVGLGHCMLHTTPESLFERLPSQRDGCVITAHARIDNREELYQALSVAQLQPLEQLADSDLILLAYQQWGKDCVDHLLGDFAFAIWDGPRKALFCARDHMGIRPLYYYKENGIFVFASEIKAILALGEVPNQINEIRVGDCLISNFSDQEITSYQNILRLPPAHWLTCQVSHPVKIHRYWKLQVNHSVELNSTTDYPALLREHFTEAVNCRLRSALPIGSHLSGGLDSSSICCVARNLLATEGRSPLHTFSNVCDSIPDSNERSFIETVLNHGEFQPHFVTEAELQGPLTKWKELFAQIEEPLIGNAYLMWELSRAAQNAQVRVVLNGYDGDTVISHGIARLSELAWQGQWSQLIEQSQALAQKNQQTGYSAGYFIQQHSRAALEQLVQSRRWWRTVLAIAQIGKYLDQPTWKLCYRYLFKPWLPQGLRSFVTGRIARFKGHRSSRTGTASTKAVSFNPEFVERTGLKQRLASQKQKPFKRESEFHCAQLNEGNFSFVLEIVDQISAIFQTETRYPFWISGSWNFVFLFPLNKN
ncbi:MAG: lasso peptide isopeptide bond-forming cyclase [Synechococcales cyanobacterium RM1_1_8]|nr:lasso peptide isopeptide bond-forming cyclase [Synechococcales cyanobacterium RM1_1_8]